MLSLWHGSGSQVTRPEEKTHFLILVRSRYMISCLNYNESVMLYTIESRPSQSISFVSIQHNIHPSRFFSFTLLILSQQTTAAVPNAHLLLGPQQSHPPRPPFTCTSIHLDLQPQRYPVTSWASWTIGDIVNTEMIIWMDDLSIDIGPEQLDHQRIPQQTQRHLLLVHRLLL